MSLARPHPVWVAGEAGLRPLPHLGRNDSQRVNRCVRFVVCTDVARRSGESRARGRLRWIPVTGCALFLLIIVVGISLDGASVRISADGLPELGATTKAKVTATASASTQQIERQYQGVRGVTVGRGWGLAYTIGKNRKPTIHHVPDDLVVVHFTHTRDCSQATPAFVGNPQGQRVPLWFVVDGARTAQGNHRALPCTNQFDPRR
jgi:hypothetical protein